MIYIIENALWVHECWMMLDDANGFFQIEIYVKITHFVNTEKKIEKAIMQFTENACISGWHHFECQNQRIYRNKSNPDMLFNLKMNALLEIIIFKEKQIKYQ